MYKIAREEITDIKKPKMLGERIALALVGVPAGVFFLSLAATLAWFFVCIMTHNTSTAFDRAVMEVLCGTTAVSLATMIVMEFAVLGGWVIYAIIYDPYGNKY